MLPAGDSSAGEGGPAAHTTYIREESYERREVIRYAAAASATPPKPPPPGSAPAPSPSRFSFSCDTRAPSELRTIRDEARRRRSEFDGRVADLGRAAAAWNARLADEAVDRHLDHDEVVRRAISGPFEEAMRRLVGRVEGTILGGAGPADAEAEADAAAPGGACAASEGEEEDGSAAGGGDGGGGGDAPPPAATSSSLSELERRLSELDAALLRHVHRTTYDSRVRHLDSVRTAIGEEVVPALRLEAAKADKREGALVRAFHGLAADAAGWHAELGAERASQVQLLGGEAEARTLGDGERIGTHLEDLREVGRLLEEEREERRREDERIMGAIVEAHGSWQRIVLESLGGE